MKVVTTPLAEADIDEIAQWIAKDDLNAALRFYAATQHTFKFLGAFPNTGTRRHSTRPQLNGLRSIGVCGFRNYIILFVPSGSEVRIIRVFHGARNIEGWIRIE